MDILELRDKINSIDDEITELFAQRMIVSKEIADYKRENGLPVLDLNREVNHLKDLKEKGGDVFGEYIVELFQNIMRLSRAYQKSCNGKFGLLGEKLGHSYSPEIHELAGGYQYDLIEVEKDNLESFIRNNKYDGFNVTIPYKKQVIPYLDELSDRAEKIGSVNTVIRMSDGKLKGDNTDYFGFRYMIDRTGVDVQDKKALVLGNGGVSPTVCAVLQDLGAKEIVVVSRNGENNYDNISSHYDSQIIVNATPVGMFPNNGKVLIDIENFSNACGVFDVIYNPHRTRLIMDAEKAGIPCSGGLSMLVAQGIAASELFLDRNLSDECYEKIISKLEKDRLNIALIAMPGAGKTTCGTHLAKLTGRTFVDMDDEIVKKIGCSIPEFFQNNDENAFRKVETEVLQAFTKQNGLIIATGGGVVTREENYPLLHENSIIVFLNRDNLASLSKKGRPISQSKDIEQLAKERMPRYTGWADYSIDCVNAYENAKKIVEELELESTCD